MKVRECDRHSTTSESLVCAEMVPMMGPMMAPAPGMMAPSAATTPAGTPAAAPAGSGTSRAVGGAQPHLFLRCCLSFACIAWLVWPVAFSCGMPSCVAKSKRRVTHNTAACHLQLSQLTLRNMATLRCQQSACVVHTSCVYRLSRQGPDDRQFQISIISFMLQVVAAPLAMTMAHRQRAVATTATAHPR